MLLTSAVILGCFTAAISACTQCPHPGNFTGKLSLFADPADASCSPGTETGIYANIPIAFFDPPDESPCDGPITFTNPSTGVSVQAIGIGRYTTGTGYDIQLTTAGLQALSPDGKANKAPKIVNWTFD